MTEQNLLEKVVSLCKRRGFVYPNSEIYGGLANAYDYGPLGAELLRNIKNLWWKKFVHGRENIYGVDGAIFSNPKVWEASGHVTSFNDVLVDCKNCQERFRVDHLILDQLGKNMEGFPLEDIARTIREEKIKCPNCGESNFTEPRKFNILFESSLGSVEGEKSTIYLRGETAQNMFLCFQDVVDSFSPKLPFGLAQIGKAFRNEVTLGNFTFRTFEFEQMEIEYFIRQENWEKHFEEWKDWMWQWLTVLGISENKLRWRKHSQEELSHYSKRTEDIEYDFPFGGFKELYGLAYRTDYDLKQHAKFSGVDLRYRDSETGEKFFPHVVEPTFGVTRTALVLLLDAYHEDGDRVVLRLNPRLAPYKAAVFPLLANKPELVEKAREVFENLKGEFRVAWDDRGNIGKRYYSQDEIGTPWCVTIDFQTLEDNTVTVRDRDTTKQVRVKIGELTEYLGRYLERA
jgi:glycyl-tRNA synthetase